MSLATSPYAERNATTIIVGGARRQDKTFAQNFRSY